MNLITYWPKQVLGYVAAGNSEIQQLQLHNMDSQHRLSSFYAVFQTSLPFFATIKIGNKTTHQAAP